MAEITDLDTTDANNTGRFPENMAFSAVNDGARALEGIIARWYADTDGSLTASGSSNAFEVTSNRTIGALFDNLMLAWTANHSITGAATLDVNGIGAKSIKGFNGEDLGSGAIVNGQVVQVVYKETADAWYLLTTPAPLASVGAASDTAQGLIEIATAAEMEAASDTARAVVPARQHRHPGHPKAWGYVEVSGGGTPSLVASYNIAGITDTGTGILTASIDTDFSSNNYCVVATAGGERMIQVASLATGSVQLRSYEVDQAISLSDPDAWHFALFGDQS